MLTRETIKKAAEGCPTPFYLFDIDEAGDEIGRMKEILPDNVRICFSIKANPFLTKALGRKADYVEACSFGELRICEKTRVPEEKIVLSGVNKGEDDLTAALEHHEDRILYTAESLFQWKVMEDFAARTGKRIKVLPRLTDGSQFGMDREEIEDILAGKYGRCAQVCGIHYFSGTQKKNIQRTLEELDRIDGCLAEWKDRFGFKPERLEFGSGMAVDYFSDEETMREREKHDLEALGEKLRSMRFQGTVTLEFGRRIAATCGRYVTAVADLKDRTEAASAGPASGKSKSGVHHYAIVDGGIHQVSWYGQMMGMKVPPVWCLDKEEGGEEEQEEYSVFGSLCSMNDVLLRKISLPRLNPGDRLVFERCGAYAPTEGMLTFLSRDLPGILTWSEEEGLSPVREGLPTDPLNCGLPAESVMPPARQAEGRDTGSQET